jgi:mono/diheme cytochrome c family protein
VLAPTRIAAIVAISLVAALFAFDRTGASDTLRQRGAYLVNAVAACGRCHTPRDSQGNPIAAMEFAGGFEFDDGVIGHVVGPNITPDRDTGIGTWTEGQIFTALRYGTRPDGTVIGAPMPLAAYRDISDSDLAAMAKYLHSMRPVRHAVARTRYKTGPSPQDQATIHVNAPQPQDKLAYGAYLAGPVGHCYGCHTILRADGSSLDRRWLYAGGRELPDYGDVTRQVVSRNITSDPVDGIGKWSDADIKRAITTGIRPDGARLARTMPSHWYKGITGADLDAIIAFLRTVKPLETPD